MTVVVVGGGVLGMMHALEARRLGHDVVHLEREPGSRGASVRNFGLIWESGRAPGPELELARRARARWDEIASDVPGVGLRPNGSLTLATDDAELQLLKEAEALPDANLREYELLDQAGPHLPGSTPLPGSTGPRVRRVRLQMMQTLPYPSELTTSVADGDSLRYYPAYDLPGRQHLPPQAPEAARSRLQLLLVQRQDGGLTIGDTHEYEEPFAFDLDESPYDHLCSRAKRLLGARVPRVQRRWAGVYSQVIGDDLYHRSEVAPGVVLVTGAGGRGMTCAPAIAEETFR
jgi:glycine/D-amino acid oxidase-like deaminating enzyme